YQAAAAGDLEAVQYFIAAGDWDHDLINHQGMTPLHAAVKGGNVDIVVLMAQQGAFIEITDTSGRTPLKYAQELGQEEVAQALQQLGATQ
ncbi:MAG: ankyrin repeat domain-containing protein, partial [Candidatus Hydrogenedentes bacterium]|nr:ankyrin repeat domain-containing protein [Candidatus Hydrogenedentota bacterium]